MKEARRGFEQLLQVSIGIDSEWVTRHNPVTGKPENQIICWQAVLAHGDKRVTLIIYARGPGRRHRITPGTLIKKVVQKAIREKVLPQFPSDITIFGHFLRADLVHFRNFWAMKRQFDGVGRTIVGQSIEVRTDDDEDQPTRGMVRSLTLTKGAGKTLRVVRVRFVDTLLLTPGRAGLAVAGEIIGLPKLILPPGHTMDRMDRLLAEDAAAFEAYALRDALVSLEYGLRLQALADSMDLPRVPITLGGFAIPLLKKKAAEVEIDLDAAMGVEIIKEVVYSERTGKYRTRKRRVPKFGRQVTDEFASLAYHGGRGEAFWFGPTLHDVWYDFDIVGAYTSAMCLLRPLDFDRRQQPMHPDDFNLDDVGAVRVLFQFPDGTRHPSLPVRSRTGGGLIYPLAGESICTPAEIVVARKMGATLEILDSMIIPYASEQCFFADFSKEIRDRRAAAGKGTFEEKMWKEIGNILYGKIAQAVHEKRSFDPQTMEMKAISPSVITCPWYAAFITGFIRALLSEILNGVPSHRTVLSATTDGLLTNAELAEIDMSGPLCQAFRRLRQIHFGTDAVLEEKHRAAQIVVIRTRGQITSETIPGHPPVLAKAGVKPDVPPAEHNDYMVRLFGNRYPDQRVSSDALIPLQEMWLTESDMVAQSGEKRLNLEFDFKREAADAWEIDFGGFRNVAFTTRPWSNIAAYENSRVRFRGWRLGHNRILRSRADLAAWQAYEVLAPRVLKEGVGLRSDGAFGHLKRQFLRALVRGAWGLDLGGMSYADVVAWLADNGISISVDDLKNAARSKSALVNQSIYVSDETIPFLRVIAEQFLNLDLEAMILPEHLDAARQALNL